MPKFNRHRNRQNRRALHTAQEQLRDRGLITKFQNPNFEQIKKIEVEYEAFLAKSLATAVKGPKRGTALDLNSDRLSKTSTAATPEKVKAALQKPKPKAGTKPPPRKALKGKTRRSNRR